MSEFFTSPVTRGALSGALAAASVDIHAFLTWKSYGEIAAYSWGTASFRWLQGAIVGGVTALGYGAVVA